MFCIVFNRLSIAKNRLRPESAPLNTLETELNFVRSKMFCFLYTKFLGIVSVKICSPRSCTQFWSGILSNYKRIWNIKCSNKSIFWQGYLNINRYTLHLLKILLILNSICKSVVIFQYDNYFIITCHQILKI